MIIWLCDVNQSAVLPRCHKYSLDVKPLVTFEKTARGKNNPFYLLKYENCAVENRTQIIWVHLNLKNVLSSLTFIAYDTHKSLHEALLPPS